MRTIKFLLIISLFAWIFTFLAIPVSAQITTCTCTCTRADGTKGDVTAQYACGDACANCSAICSGASGFDAYNSTDGCTQKVSSTGGSSTPSPNKPVSIEDPLGIKGAGPSVLYARIIKALLAFVGVAALVTFVYSGFMFIFSTGNQDRVKKAKDTMVYAVVGVFVAMASYAILSWIFNILEQGTGN